MEYVDSKELNTIKYRLKEVNVCIHIQIHLHHEKAV